MIPAILASVVGYSVVTAIYGESRLLAHAVRYPFIPAHLPLYILLAVLVSLLGMVFLITLRGVQRSAAKLPGPSWLRPTFGGLLLGLLCVPIIVWFGHQSGQPGQGLGLLGGGYGAAQLAITGASWLKEGWSAVGLLLLLALVKLLAASLTIGSGGSAGDFAPSLALGGLLGGAVGRALALMLGDPRIDAGALALVGMGAFYGGVANAPLSSLVLICELAGSYDLLVPLMLAEGVCFVALRRWSLYPAQVPTQRESPVHRGDHADVLSRLQVAQAMNPEKNRLSFLRHTPAREILEGLGEFDGEATFPVLDANQRLVGVIPAEALLVLAGQIDSTAGILAADVMQPARSVRPTDSLHHATRLLLQHHCRELPVVDDDEHVIGFLDEADITRIYLETSGQQQPQSSQPA